jgi:hypothetical protein
MVFLLFFFYLFVYLFFPFSLPSLLSLSSHPSILKIVIVIIKARQYRITHSTGTVIIARAMMGIWKKRETTFPQ